MRYVLDAIGFERLRARRQMWSDLEAIVIERRTGSGDRPPLRRGRRPLRVEADLSVVYIHWATLAPSQSFGFRCVDPATAKAVARVIREACGIGEWS